MKYRFDIEGLRAIAVLAVIFYHLDFPVFSGGYVGVDVFFVISGFLITGIIHGELQTGRFTLAGFYARRIRRIIPAIVVVASATTLAALVFIPEWEFNELAKSVVSVAFFVSNVFFWLHTDYFSVAAELKPLLHTWSLSVEEQFYIFFPILMVAIRRLSKRHLALTLIVLATLSFGLSVYIQESHADANFFLAPTRAWELLLGGLLAIGFVPGLTSRLAGGLLSLTGLSMILLSTVILTDQSVFPGVNALAPCLGTALIIYGGAAGSSPVSALLSNRFAGYVGRISYSLYLWHWPVAVMVRSSVTGELTYAHKLMMLAVIFALSDLSYHWIESPFRRPGRLTQAGALRFGFASVVALAVVGSGLFVYSRGSDYAAELAREEDRIEQLLSIQNCFESSAVASDACAFGDLESERTFLLWADSHGDALLPVFEKFARENGWRGMKAVLRGCPPLFDVFRIDGIGNASNCDGRFAKNLGVYLKENPVDVVVLVSRWGLFQNGYITNGRLRADTHFISDAGTRSEDAASSAAVLARAIENTARRLTESLGVRVIILASIPELPGDIKHYEPGTAILTREEHLANRAFVDAQFARLRGNPRITIMDPTDTLCPRSECMAFSSKHRGHFPLYKDSNHLSYRGSLLLYPLLERTFD